MAGRRLLNTTIKHTRIGYTDRDGDGSCNAYISDFHNAMMQVRTIAFDGRRWFVQPDNSSRFKQVSEDEVPKDVKERFARHLLPKDHMKENF